MFIRSSLAEICSSYPTLGGLHYWIAKLADKDWPPFASRSKPEGEQGLSAVSSLESHHCRSLQYILREKSPPKVDDTIRDPPFNIVGQWAVTTSVEFSQAQLIQVIILLSQGKNDDGYDYEASKYVVIVFHGGFIHIHAIITAFLYHFYLFFFWLICCMEYPG
ncbi:hypothetical protein NE237_016868 [Protea cynaroides]|uniref:Uncharacterized protein n=1 Tax=Protea cynaroides TaxID=273540 RepID=A0A9Q0HJ38_9MAGN|nr:hypothetical protein NE237_016868 [Protea cynaroides]